MRSLLLILHFRKVPYHMSLVDGPAHLNPWKKMMETLKFLHCGTPWGPSTRQRIALVAFRPFMEKLLYKYALPHKCPIMFDAPLVGEIRSHTHTIEFKGFDYKFQQSLTSFLYEFHNSLPPPPGLIFKGRPSNHKLSWERISIYLILTSQVTNSLHPNIIMHILHTVLFIFSRF